MPIDWLHGGDAADVLFIDLFLSGVRERERGGGKNIKEKGRCRIFDLPKKTNRKNGNHRRVWRRLASFRLSTSAVAMPTSITVLKPINFSRCHFNASDNQLETGSLTIPAAVAQAIHESSSQSMDRVSHCKPTNKVNKFLALLLHIRIASALPQSSSNTVQLLPAIHPTGISLPLPSTFIFGFIY